MNDILLQLNNNNAMLQISIWKRDEVAGEGTIEREIAHKEPDDVQPHRGF